MTTDYDAMIGPTTPGPTDFLGRVNRPAQSYDCHFCRKPVRRADVIVVRIGTPDDRPDGCVRLNLCDECAHGSTIAYAVKFVGGLREP